MSKTKIFDVRVRIKHLELYCLVENVMLLTPSNERKALKVSSK